MCNPHNLNEGKTKKPDYLTLTETYATFYLRVADQSNPEFAYVFFV